MSDLFEVITQEEFETSGVGRDLGRTYDPINGGEFAVPRPPTLETELTYCEFCKGYYNEYHFGDVDAPV